MQWLDSSYCLENCTSEVVDEDLDIIVNTVELWSVFGLFLLSACFVQFLY